MDPTSAVDDSTSRPRPSGRLGRYRLCFELAAGGMATVYLARIEGDAGFEKVVAIKLVHRHLAKDTRFTEMFLDEARLAARIDHPNVCTVFDFGTVDGTSFIAMEYLMGESFLRVAKEVARRKRPDELSRLPWYAARIFADVCEGLHAAHELRDPDGNPMGVVHRDVTPQNLVLTYEGSVKVVDFGVAKAATQLHQTEVGKIKGKLSYVAPEQLRNLPLDRRTDVWALGVCIWELLTLKRLFRRDSGAATMMAVAHDPIPCPSEVRSWVPPELDAIVMRALDRDRDVRYPTARELGRALTKFLSSSPVTVGMAEIAEWMEAMFAEERDRRIALLRAARNADHLDVLPAYPDGVSSTDSVAAPISVEVAPADVGEATAADPSPLADALPHPPAPTPTRRWPLALGLVGVALAAAVGYGSARMGSATPQVTGLPPRTAPEPSTAPSGPPAPEAHSALPVMNPAPGPSAEASPTETAAGPEDASRGVEEAQVAETASAPRAPDAEAAPAPTGGASPQRARSRRRRPRQASAPAERLAGGATAANEMSEPSGRGHVVVLNIGGGWAEVFAGSRRLGRTPVRGALPVGTHRIRVLPYGSEPAYTETVVVRHDEDVLIRIRIEER